MLDSSPISESQIESEGQYALPAYGSPGRLAQSTDSGAEKRRIFAIGNYVNQRLLKPFHDWFMKALSTLPMDGTFNQLSPLDRLVGESRVYSYDLKSATDRWPLYLHSDISY